MKRIEAVIRPTMVGKVCAALERAGHLVTKASYVEDGSQLDTGYLLRGATYRADLAVRSRIELIVQDGETGTIVRAIRDAAFTGGAGDGEIFVYAMEDVMGIKSVGEAA